MEAQSCEYAKYVSRIERIRVPCFAAGRSVKARYEQPRNGQRGDS
jgi:hypothetical protein